MATAQRLVVQAYKDWLGCGTTFRTATAHDPARGWCAAVACCRDVLLQRLLHVRMYSMQALKKRNSVRRDGWKCAFAFSEYTDIYRYIGIL
jgi:hypothetical protein